MIVNALAYVISKKTKKKKEKKKNEIKFSSAVEVMTINVSDGRFPRFIIVTVLREQKI